MLHLGLGPKVESHASQGQRYQHQCHGKVNSPQNDAMGLWKSHQQYANTQNQPGLIGIPKRTDACNHHVFLSKCVCVFKQSTYTQVVAVQNYVGEHGQGHNQGKDNG